MAAKIDLGEESKMNMTPMIDVTFLLVTFFMLTLDLSSKEYVPVDLPYAYHGVEVKPDTDSDIPKFVINLLRGGAISFKGKSYDLTEDPKQQDQALFNLRRELTEMTREAKYREPDGASKVVVQIHGDRTAKWQYAQWIMMVCVHPSLKIYKFEFAVKKPAEET
jgi:biopolymer transport protein ExbD